jgi:hypothetical protein
MVRTSPTASPFSLVTTFKVQVSVNNVANDFLDGLFFQEMRSMTITITTQKKQKYLGRFSKPVDCRSLRKRRKKVFTSICATAYKKPFRGLATVSFPAATQFIKYFQAALGFLPISKASHANTGFTTSRLGYFLHINFRTARIRTRSQQLQVTILSRRKKIWSRER